MSELQTFGMAQSFQVAPPEPFSFKKPDEWPKWIRRFERFRLASGLDEKEKVTQVNALIYAMGDEADNIIAGFRLIDEEKRDYDVVKTKFDGHFVVCRNAIFELAKFSRRSQEEGECVDSFITLLSRTLRIWHSERRNNARSHCRRDHRYVVTIEVAKGW